MGIPAELRHEIFGHLLHGSHVQDYKRIVRSSFNYAVGVPDRHFNILRVPNHTIHEEAKEVLYRHNTFDIFVSDWTIVLCSQRISLPQKSTNGCQELARLHQDPSDETRQHLAKLLQPLRRVRVKLPHYVLACCLKQETVQRNFKFLVISLRESNVETVVLAIDKPCSACPDNLEGLAAHYQELFANAHDAQESQSVFDLEAPRDRSMLSILDNFRELAESKQVRLEVGGLPKFEEGASEPHEGFPKRFFRKNTVSD